MQVAVRPYVTTGIALVGASVIALSPVAVAPPEVELPAIQKSTAVVQLAANPITAWFEVFGESAENVGLLAEAILANPVPILERIFENQLANAELLGTVAGDIGAALQSVAATFPVTIQSAFEQLASGEIAGGIDTLFQAFFAPVLQVALAALPAYEVISNAAQNFANVVAAVPIAALPILLSPIYPLMSGVPAFGDIAQAVFDGVTSGDLGAAAEALLSAPAILVGAVLNGYEGTPGILTTPFGSIANFVVFAREQIANALQPVGSASMATMAAAATAAADGGVEETGGDVSDPITASGEMITLDIKSAAVTDDGEEDPDAALTTEETEEDGGKSVGTDSVAGEDAEVDETGTEDESAIEDDPATVDDGSGTANGGTDLSDGNKVTPGDSVSNETGDGGTGSGDDDAEVEGDTDGDETTGGGSGSTDGGDASDDSGDGSGDGGDE